MSDQRFFGVVRHVAHPFSRVSCCLNAATGSANQPDEMQADVYEDGMGVDGKAANAETGGRG